MSCRRTCRQDGGTYWRQSPRRHEGVTFDQAAPFKVIESVSGMEDAEFQMFAVRIGKAKSFFIARNDATAGLAAVGTASIDCQQFLYGHVVFPPLIRKIFG